MASGAIAGNRASRGYDRIAHVFSGVPTLYASLLAS